MSKVLLIIGLFLAFASGELNAQKVWTLEECIRYAHENNIQIKRQELNVNYGKNNYLQSYFNTLPNLNGSFSHSFSEGKTIDYSVFDYVNQSYWSSNMGLSSNLTLFSGLQLYNNILYNRFLFLKNQADLEKTKNDISLQLTMAYLQVLFSKELVEVAKSRLEVTGMQVERARKMLEAGNVAQGEYLQMRAQEANEKTSLTVANNNLDIALLDLTQILDLESTEGFEVLVPAGLEISAGIPLPEIDEIYELALKSMPQVRSAEYSLQSSEKQLNMAWGQLSPTISLSGYLSSRYSQLAKNPLLGQDEEYKYLDQVNDYFYKQFSVGLSVPIFNRLQVKNSISNAKISVEDTRLQLDMVMKALYKEVQQAHADARAAGEKYFASMEAVSYNEEAFKYTSQRYEVGLVSVVDYSLSQSNLFKAQSDMLQAKYEYVFKLKILDLYMDKPITL